MLGHKFTQYVECDETMKSLKASLIKCLKHFRSSSVQVAVHATNDTVCIILKKWKLCRSHEDTV